MPAVFEWPTVPPRPPVASAFWRAARLHCPACGGGPVFLSWLRIGPACPSCGLNFTRGERGYWLGAYFVNLMAVEAIFAVMLGGIDTFLGPLLGAMILLALNDVVTRFTEYHGLVLGIVILVFALGLRRGVLDFLRLAWPGKSR